MAPCPSKGENNKCQNSAARVQGHQIQPEYSNSTPEASLVSILTAIPVDKGHQNRFRQQNKKTATINYNNYFKDSGVIYLLGINERNPQGREVTRPVFPRKL